MLYERNKKIAIMVLSGETYNIVAKKFSLSRARIGQITCALCHRAMPEIYKVHRKSTGTVKMNVLRNHAREFVDAILKIG